MHAARTDQICMHAYLQYIILDLVVDRGLVGGAGRPPGGDDVAGDELLAGARRQADGQGRLQGRPGVELPDGAPRRLHGRPQRPSPGLHEVDGGEVAVAVHVLNEHGEVLRVRAGVDHEG